MRDINAIAQDITTMFRNAVLDKTGTDPIPHEKYEEIQAFIAAYPCEIIDPNSLKEFQIQFETALAQFGDDIPNDHKIDILFITKEHILAIQFSQYACLVTQTFLQLNKNIHVLTDVDFDNIAATAITCAKTIQNDANQTTDAIRLLTDKINDRLLHCENPVIITPNDYGTLQAMLVKWSEAILHW